MRLGAKIGGFLCPLLVQVIAVKYPDKVQKCQITDRPGHCGLSEQQALDFGL